MPYLGSQIRDFALFTFVPERTLCTRWRHSRHCFLMWWCLVRHWRRRHARGSRQRRDLVVTLFLCLRWWWRHSGRVARNSGLSSASNGGGGVGSLDLLALLVHGGLSLSYSDRAVVAWVWASRWVARSVLVKVWPWQRLSTISMARMSAAMLMVVQAKYPCGFGSSENRGRKVPPMASVDTRGQKSPFFASPQYASILEPGQNIKNNRSQKPLLH